jgi:hypothetical protein
MFFIRGQRVLRLCGPHYPTSSYEKYSYRAVSKRMWLVLFIKTDHARLAPQITECLSGLQEEVIKVQIRNQWRFYFLAVLGFELKALHLLGRHSITWAMPPTLFTVIFQIRSPICVCLGWPGLQSSYLRFLLSWDNRYVPLCPAFTWLGWGLLNFFPGVALNYNPPNLHFWVPRITGVSHHFQLQFLFLAVRTRDIAKVESTA